MQEIIADTTLIKFTLTLLIIIVGIYMVGVVPFLNENCAMQTILFIYYIGIVGLWLPFSLHIATPHPQCSRYMCNAARQIRLFKIIHPTIILILWPLFTFAHIIALACLLPWLAKNKIQNALEERNNYIMQQRTIVAQQHPMNLELLPTKIMKNHLECKKSIPKIEVE